MTIVILSRNTQCNANLVVFDPPLFSVRCHDFSLKQFTKVVKRMMPSVLREIVMNHVILHNDLWSVKRKTRQCGFSFFFFGLH